MELLEELFTGAQQWLFETAVQPIMFSFGMGHLLEDGYTATGWLLVGLIQIAILLAVIGPLQRMRPVEPMVDVAAIRTDVVYTLLHRLGIFRVALFFSVEPLFDELFGALKVAGFSTWHLDQVWAGISDLPWASFLIYLVVFDFVDYWIHRGQHAFNWAS